MDFLKKLFPMSFQKSSETGNLVKRIVIYAVGIVLVAIAAFLIGLLNVPVLSLLLGFVVSLVELYCTAGIVLAILVHCNVIKVGDSNNNTEA